MAHPATTVSTAPTRAPRGWHRPVRPGALLAVGGALLLLWLALMAGGVVWFYAQFESHITVRDQAMRLRLPAGLPAMVEVSQPLSLQLPPTLAVQVPIRQDVAVQVQDSVQAHVQLDTVLPVHTDVRVTHEVPVATVARLHAPVFRWLPSFDVTVPVTVRLPIDLVIPVRAEVPLNLDVAVSGDLHQSVVVPVDTVVTVRPEIKQSVQARMQALTAFALREPQQPVAMTISHANLRVPFDLMRVTQTVP